MSCSSHSASSAAFGVCEQTSMSACRRTAPGTGARTGNGGTPRTMSAIALLTASDQASACFRSASPVSATAFSSAGLPSFDSRAIQSISPCGFGDVDAAGLHFRPAAQPVELLDQRRKAVRPAALRIQVDELGRLAGILAHALQLVVIDEVRDEALLVLQLHRIEDAAVRIDADQEIVLRRDVENMCRILLAACEIGRVACMTRVARPEALRWAWFRAMNTLHATLVRRRRACRTRPMTSRYAIQPQSRRPIRRQFQNAPVDFLELLAEARIVSACRIAT